MYSFYELHKHVNPEFPFVFDRYNLEKHHNTGLSGIHWHESLELLYCVSGSGIVFDNTFSNHMIAGDLVVVNSGEMHTVCTEDKDVRYYCLIIDKSFSDEMGIDVEKLRFESIIRGNRVGELFGKLSAENDNPDDYSNWYRKGIIIELLIYLCRNHLIPENIQSKEHDYHKINMVKAAISYIRQHYQETFSTEDVCKSIGFSKYYFCRVFREYTGTTVTDYLNYLRCSNARSLMRSGNYNVNESARMCGIDNMSYFSRMYRRYMGVPPSEDCYKTE